MIWELQEHQPYTLAQISQTGSAADEEGIRNALGYLQQRATVVLWTIQEILWGTWQDGRLLLPSSQELKAEHLLELRAFNEQEEVFLSRQGNALLGRYVLDGKGERYTDFIDSEAWLWGEIAGTSQEDPSGYAKLADNKRKISMYIPMEGTPMEGAICFLATRNYIGSLANGQAGYVDSRYLRVTVRKGGNGHAV